MKRNSIKERAKRVPRETKIFVDKSMSTARQIIRILEKQGKSQRDLAILLGKRESEISKWLTGTHNFTFRTISKIESVLNAQITTIPVVTVHNYLLSGYSNWEMVPPYMSLREDDMKFQVYLRSPKTFSFNANEGLVNLSLHGEFN